jgi:hypothetical protein
VTVKESGEREAKGQTMEVPERMGRHSTVKKAENGKNRLTKVE